MKMWVQMVLVLEYKLQAVEAVKHLDQVFLKQEHRETLNKDQDSINSKETLIKDQDQINSKETSKDQDSINTMSLEQYMKIIPVVLMDVLVLEFKLLKEILEEEIRIISQKVSS